MHTGWYGQCRHGDIVGFNDTSSFRLNSKGETLLHVACRAGYQRYLDLKDQLEAEDAAEQARRRELPAPIQQDGKRQSDVSNLEAESSKRRDDDCVARITAVKEESHEMLYILLDRALADYQGRYSVLSLNFCFVEMPQDITE